MLLLLPFLTCATTPEDHYQAGLAALKAKDAPAARASLQACVDADPARADCRWELGWACWLGEDWQCVVDQWTQVKTLDPAMAPQVERNLPTAQGNLEVQRLVKASASRAPATVRTPPPAGATLRLRAVGDTMIGSDFPDDRLGPPDILAKVNPWLKDADLTFANLEGPWCDSGETTKCKPGSTSCYAFRTPTRLGPLLVEAGIDLASTANNHAGDFGDVCRLQTEAMLDGLGIAHSGRPGDIARLEKNGLRIAMIGFHTSDTTHDVRDIPTAVQLVKAVAMDADIVIVSFHGGAEGSKALHVPEGTEMFLGENRGDLRAFTHAVIDAGADLVLGHGPHVPRAMEVYKDRLIAYSMGNFATYGRFNLSGYMGKGMVLEVTLDNTGRFAGGTILSTLQEGDGIPAPDPANAAADLVRQLSEEDFPTSGVRVGQDGSLARR